MPILNDILSEKKTTRRQHLAQAELLAKQISQLETGLRTAKLCRGHQLNYAGRGWTRSDMTRYLYLGDRLTDPALKGQPCTAVRRDDGKCIRGRNGNMLVEFSDGRQATVIGRLLRKLKLDIKYGD